MTARAPGAFVALTLAAAVLSVAVASAADPPPSPGCAGTFATDPPGDQSSAGGEPGSGPENLDALAGWFTKGTDGKLTGNIRIANLDQSLPDAAAAIAWYVYWNDAEGAVKYAGASSDGETAEFTFGTLATNRYMEEGETTGTLFEGENGVVQVVIPDSIAKTGDTLSAPYGDTRITTGGPVGPRLLSRADAVPDDTAAGGKDYTVGACESAQPTPEPTPEPTPTATPSPTPSPAPSPTATPTPTPTPTPAADAQQSPSPQPTPAPQPASTPGPSQPPAGGGDPPSSGGTTTRRARLSIKTTRAKAGRTLRIRVRSTRRVSSVRATLRRGKRTVARGRLARSINGSATVRVRAAKRLRRGRYTLQLTGRDAGGAKVSTRRRLILR